MIEIPKTSKRWEGEKGTWFSVIRDGKPSPIINCPKCGREQSLPEHNIDSEGNVTPSVVCYYNPESCDFHDLIRLVGWQKKD